MKISSDFVDLLKEFSAADVRFLIIGAVAVWKYSRFRMTSDYDVWIEASQENAARAYRALARFGAPLEHVSINDLTSDDLIYQIGVIPNRIDVLTSIDGVTFAEAWPQREPGVIDGLPVYFIGRNELLKNKRASGRSKDLADVEMIEKHGARKK